uniref:'chromo' domain containing protein n=1 Tax=Solanum tuberosum TaxID=4113 RepID=M1DZQ3_SOLTU
MVNITYNGVRPVAPVNAPAEESAARGHGRGRGRGRSRGRGHGRVAPARDKAETTGVPPIDPMLAQQIMSFLKGLVGPGVLHSSQETQAPANLPIAITVPKVGGNVGLHTGSVSRAQPRTVIKVTVRDVSRELHLIIIILCFFFHFSKYARSYLYH